ncbi:hypothetical protein DSM106972_009930 [Dulcicalothrix desertica PCC 7102]|uniref:Uncharacterized protein n=1 Tax=Dulcicalothrix desertica PCC 7102 TaxID=232991 RepID=A0A3S1AQX7_9CYAN|nr:hypothetical protein DSM106972_009930 [Dulcicalothrix desertica PCC 7102]
MAKADAELPNSTKQTRIKDTAVLINLDNICTLIMITLVEQASLPATIISYKYIISVKEEVISQLVE